MKRCLVRFAVVAVATLSFASSASAFGYLTQWGNAGTGDGQFGASAGPEGIVPGADGNIYVVDRGNNRVQVFSPTGAFITKWGSFGTGDGLLNGPFGIATDYAGNFYVVDSFNHRVEKFSSTGSFLEGLGVGRRRRRHLLRDLHLRLPGRPAGHGRQPVPIPLGVAVDAGDSVYVVGDGDSRVEKFDSDGDFVAKWGSQGTANNQFDHPVGVATDSAGNVYVADTDNTRVEVRLGRKVHHQVGEHAVRAMASSRRAARKGSPLTARTTST